MGNLGQFLLGLVEHMMPRQLSQNPATVERRERRIMAAVNKDEREHERKVIDLIENEGMSFDEAFIACGGTIVPLMHYQATRMRAELKAWMASLEDWPH